MSLEDVAGLSPLTASPDAGVSPREEQTATPPSATRHAAAATSMSASPPTDGPTRDVVCLPKMYRALSAHILSAQQLAHEHSQMLASLYVQQVLTSIAAGPAAEYLLAGPSSVGATVSTTTLQVTSTKTNVTTNAARGGRRPSSSPITPGRAAAPAALEGDSAAAQGSGASGKRRLEKSPLGNEYGMWASEAVAAFTGLERSCALLTQHLSNAPRPLVRCAAVATDLAGAAVDASLMAGHAEMAVCLVLQPMASSLFMGDLEGDK